MFSTRFSTGPRSGRRPRAELTQALVQRCGLRREHHIRSENDLPDHGRRPELHHERVRAARGAEVHRLAAGAGLRGADPGVRAELARAEEAELPAVAIAVPARHAPAISGPVEDGVRRAARPTGRQEANAEAGRRGELQKLEAALAVLAGEDTSVRREKPGTFAEQDLASRKATAVGDEQRGRSHTRDDGDDDDTNHRRSVEQSFASRKLRVVISIPTEKG